MRSLLGRAVRTMLPLVALACRAAPAAEAMLAEEAAFRAAVARVAAAVVRIEPLPGADAAVGGPSTGLVIDAAGLVLATAFAVPESAREAVVVLPDGRRLAAAALGRDEPRGIVLLKTDPLPAAPPLEAVPRASLEPGQWAIAVGRGWSATEPSMAVGILSAVDRGWGLAVQTDAAVSPMNYGGPLVDLAGRVIGVVAPLPAEPANLMRGTELYDAGIGFAVPLAEILESLPRLIAGEALVGGTLGIGYRSADRINGEPVIASVRQASPAARIGLRPGDRIVAIDGRPIRRIADARHAITPRHAGDRVELEVARGRDAAAPTLRVSPTLVARLPPWRRAILGIVAAARDDEHEDAAAGIAWVLPGGPGDRAGIVAGGSIASIVPVDHVAAGEPVENPSPPDIAGVLAGLEPGQAVRLGVRRGSTVTPVEVVLGELPGDVPAESPPRSAAGLPESGDAVEVVRLGNADVATPAVAVVPAGRGAMPVLVWCDLPSGPIEDAAATVWKAAAAATGVAVILPGSRDRRAWSRDDVATVVRAIESLHARRRIDATRVGVAGRGAGGGFAWILAERLSATCGGVAVLDAPLPAGIAIPDAEPGTARWLLLGGSADESAARRRGLDRERLLEAGHAVGTLPDAAAGGPPTGILCRWAALLGLL